MVILSLIKTAQLLNVSDTTERKNVQENIKYFAKKENMSAIGLAESITHVLAGLAQTKSNMHPHSVAALLAGVEKLATDLPNSEDPTKKQNTLRVLASAAMNHDKLSGQSLPNHSVVVIAQHGAKFPDVVQKYDRVLAGANADQELDEISHHLNAMIQRAMNTSATMKQDPASTGAVPSSINKPNIPATAGVPTQHA